MYLAVAEQALTRLLQEQRPSSKDTALTPAHAIAEIVQCDLLRTLHASKARLRYTSFTVESRNWYILRAGEGKAWVALVVGLIAEYRAATWACRWRSHLHREVAPWEDRVGLAVRVWHLLHLHGVESDTDTHASSALRIVDQDELTALGFR